MPLQVSCFDPGVLLQLPRQYNTKIRYDTRRQDTTRQTQHYTTRQSKPNTRQTRHGNIIQDLHTNATTVAIAITIATTPTPTPPRPGPYYRNRRGPTRPCDRPPSLARHSNLVCPWNALGHGRPICKQKWRWPLAIGACPWPKSG